MPNTEICFLTATEMARRIRAKELSAIEVMEAHLEQIERVNPKVNAIVTFLPEQAREQARAADKALAQGEEEDAEAAQKLRIRAGELDELESPGAKWVVQTV